jgi:hypothetical protein
VPLLGEEEGAMVLGWFRGCISLASQLSGTPFTYSVKV